MKKLLVVEDDDLVRRSIVRSIRAFMSDIEIVLAINGQEAVRKFADDEEIVYVLSDINMPELSGVALHGRIHEELQEREGLFIAMTGNCTKEQEEYFMSHDVTLFIKGSPIQKLLQRYS